jgi:hypothetical protein
LVTTLIFQFRAGISDTDDGEQALRVRADPANKMVARPETRRANIILTASAKIEPYLIASNIPQSVALFSPSAE